MEDYRHVKFIFANGESQMIDMRYFEKSHTIKQLKEDTNILEGVYLPEPISKSLFGTFFDYLVFRESSRTENMINVYMKGVDPNGISAAIDILHIANYLDIPIVFSDMQRYIAESLQRQTLGEIRVFLKMEEEPTPEEIEEAQKYIDSLL